MTLSNQIIKAFGECQREMGADLLLVNSPMRNGIDDDIRAQLAGRATKASEVIVILVTEGGVADVAYRAARALQASYDKIAICIPGWCKSAGTLFAIAGHELIIGDKGELGPLDVQVAVRDEIGDRNSGLILQSALETMRKESFALFESSMMNIKARSGNLVTFRTAADLAVQLTVGLMKPVFEQIDPIKLGDDARSQEIGYHYGLRLNLHSQNLQGEDALNQLLYGYPSHSFVVDRTESENLFRNVKPINGSLHSVIECLGDMAHTPQAQPVVVYLDGDDVEEEAANDGGADLPAEPEAEAEGNLDGQAAAE
jgi:hypothetical protein